MIFTGRIPMLKKKIRWGIVGPGTIANKFAIAVKNLDCAELVAVASRSIEKGRKFAELYGIPNVFCGYEEMAKSDAIDAVYIATPHPFHKPCAEIFLNAGKHVLSEKPLCINKAQALALKECAKKNGVFLMEAMWTRFLPAIKEMLSVAESGEIGEVLGIRADFCYSCPPEEDAKIYDPDLAGGALLDVGVYALHFTSLLFGNEPEEIKVVAAVENGVDTRTNFILKYKGGRIANLSSAINLYKPEEAYVYGTSGYIYIPKFYGAQEFSVNTDGKIRNVSSPSIGEGFEEEIIEVCECINACKTESDVMPLDKSIAILGLMDKIREDIGVVYPFDKEN